MKAGRPGRSGHAGRFCAAVLVAAILTALAGAVWPGMGGERAGGARARGDEAVAVAVRAQPAVVPSTPRPGDNVALLVVVVSLVGLAAAGRRLSRRAGWGRMLASPRRTAVHPRGPPLFAS